MQSVLAVDIGSGGVTAARVDPDLGTTQTAESAWHLERDAQGTATLSPRAVVDAVTSSVRQSADALPPPQALVIASMMHTVLVVDSDGVPRTPVFTWLDTAGIGDEATLRQRLGSGYTRRTGAWCHPSFPAYKLARIGRRAPETFAPPHRIQSLPGYIQFTLTGEFAEDEGTASASGLLNLESGTWDPETIEALRLNPDALPDVRPSGAVIGHLHADAAAELLLPPGTPVIAGGGDGFLASIGSGCRTPDRLAITLGTTAGVRRFQRQAEDVTDSGLFCYRFRPDHFLVGCASNNGGNVLDWAGNEFGIHPSLDLNEKSSPPIFLPFVFGERAPFWDTRHEARWFGVSEHHTPLELGLSVTEAVTFALGMYVRLISESLGPPSIGVLSGNGFRTPGLTSLLASIVPCPLVVPPEPGTSTLRGAALMAFEALGIVSDDAVERLFDLSLPIDPVKDGAHLDRFERFAEYYRQQAG